LQNLEDLIKQNSINQSSNKRRTTRRTAKPSGRTRTTVAAKTSGRRVQKSPSVASRMEKTTTASQTIQNATTPSISPAPKTTPKKKLADRVSPGLYTTSPSQLTEWGFIRKHLSKEVRILSETSRNLVLFDPASKQKLTLSLYKTPEAHIYAVRKRKRGGNPYRAWYAASNLAKGNSAETVNLSRFFSKRFKERIIFE